MKGKILKNRYGKESLLVRYDEQTPTEVFVEDGCVMFWVVWGKGYTSDLVGIDIEDWQEVKEWVDSQIDKGVGND